ncbi:RIC1-domain-containing protein [Desarmillaria tabescens]|uniref:RIC1-domain-containing protein n=1 Tax=Armillaria tabescens TaxID=1929756 RepID=A0AA39TWC7_ARMTA|nr:RIC1-domain-containing protein [Desarmillaria tabescens]KAK0465224.1 RIC1-domain-containing protein [Desarmillaria tabescens]
MYFPTSTARRLSTVPALPNIPPEHVVGLCPSPRKSFFATLTRNGISIWRVRPTAVLAHLSRTPTSTFDHGENVKAYWAPDGSRIVIQTSLSYLVLITVTYDVSDPVYQPPILTAAAQRNFLAGPGEGLPLNPIGLHFEGVIRVEGTLISTSPRRHYILFSTKNPPAVQRIPWPSEEDEPQNDYEGQEPRRNKRFGSYDTWIFNDHEFEWFVEPDWHLVHARVEVTVAHISTWITSDGRAYFVQLHESESEEESSTSEQVEDEKPNGSNWHGTCVHDFPTPRWVQKQRRIDPNEPLHERNRRAYVEPKQAVCVALNSRFSLIAVGMLGGGVALTSFPASPFQTSPLSSTPLSVPNPYNRDTGPVCALEWTSDGYVLAVGWKHGWALFSVGGRCLASGGLGSGEEGSIDEKTFQDTFMHGVLDLFWTPGNFELVLLAQLASHNVDGQLFAVPFAKSATTGQQSPDNTRYAFLQMDDRALVYRGADQPDMSVINPESDVWQHVKIPLAYLSTNWPIRYSALSSDGRLIAVAGRRGLVHYSSSSGRWKVFTDELQEQAFAVRGGLIWFHHVLIAAVEMNKTYQIRLYSRDLELSNQNVLHRETLSTPVIILSLVDNSLLVYTADNALFHYLIVPTEDTIKLHLCGSITFNGIIAAPGAVRMLSWMIPSAQKQLGDPVEDLAVATVLMVVGGQLVLLRPRKSAEQEVQYDMQIFADRIEFCWIHLRGIGALENSLWGYDGQSMRVWLNALAIEAPPHDSPSDLLPKNVKESVNIPLDFYPLSVLMDKGIIIGAEHEAATRSNLPFVMFRHATSSHLFLHHALLCYLEARHIQEAVVFASHYQNLVYFAHALEILLHTVVESEASLDDESSSDAENAASILPTVIEFLDHFDEALDVVVRCARKTEMIRWRRLFSIVGNPKALFEMCLSSQRLRTASSYLLVLHTLEQLDEDNEDAVRLLKAAIEGKDWQLCRELLRFLHSIDDSGIALQNALAQTNLGSRDGSSLVGNGASH